jgi:adenosylmethionine-8-amino-7-oxononanoate aminotransferase
VLAFIVEPVGGASTGALVPPAGYMQAVREICDRYGVLLIHDEVMSGGGRTGKFMAGEHWGCAGHHRHSKGFAAGYAPLGAMVAQRRLIDPVLDAGGFLHGLPMPAIRSPARPAWRCSRKSNAMIMGNAARVGAVLKSRLEGLMQRYSGHRRRARQGLLLAFELVSDRQTMQPLPALNAYSAC